jgi:hypothetical protein
VLQLLDPACGLLMELRDLGKDLFGEVPEHSGRGRRDQVDAGQGLPRLVEGFGRGAGPAGFEVGQQVSQKPSALGSGERC